MWFIFPLDKPRYITQNYTNSHKAIDWGAPNGIPLYASRDGTVTYVRNRYNVNDNNCNYGYGNYITISHGNINNCDWKTLYAHVHPDTEVVANDKVKTGELIGYIDNNGCSTGPHLHFEIRCNNIKVNPLNYLIEKPPEPIVLPEFPTLPKAKTNYRLNVREKPVYGSRIWYVLEQGEKFRVQDAIEDNGDIWLKIGHKMYCAMVYNGEQYVIFI